MKQKKKRMSDKNRFSLLTDDLEHCYVCGSSVNINLHEIYYGSLYREQSKNYGLVVPLCGVFSEGECHEGTYGVHGSKGRALDLRLKQEGQRAFESHYPHLDFLAIFGKNYLAMEK
jgi:hypothetical protein